MAQVKQDYYISCPDGSQTLSAYGMENTNKKRAEENEKPIEDAYYDMIFNEEKKKGKLDAEATKIATEARNRFVSHTCPEPVAPVTPDATIVPSTPPTGKKWATVKTPLVPRGGKRKTRTRRGKKRGTRRR